MDWNNVQDDGTAWKHHMHGMVGASKPKASQSIYIIAIQNMSDMAMAAQNNPRIAQNKHKIMLE